MKFSFANLIAEAHLIKLDVYKLDFTTDTHTNTYTNRFGWDSSM